MLNYSWTCHCVGQIPFGHYHLMLSRLVDCVVLASQEIRELREAKKLLVGKGTGGDVENGERQRVRRMFLFFVEIYLVF